MKENGFCNILLIEDDPGDALLVAEMLDEQGFNVNLFTASRLSEGIDYLGHHDFDVVLLDMNLPDSNGFSTMTRLLEAAPTTPVIAMTGLSDESFGIAAVKSGAQDYLIKGDVDGRLLKRSIFYAVERKKTEIALKQTKDLFEQQARIDYLTGIYNRMMFNELTQAEIQRSYRRGFHLSLIMFDLDHFKNINDTYGHDTGDHVLKNIASLVSENIRTHDILARWGGEEFVVLAPHSDQRQAVTISEKLRCACKGHDFGNGLSVTASFGVTQLRPGDDVKSLVARSDEALYLAKKNGRDRVEAL